MRTVRRIFMSILGLKEFKTKRLGSTVDTSPPSTWLDQRGSALETLLIYSSLKHLFLKDHFVFFLIFALFCSSFPHAGVFCRKVSNSDGLQCGKHGVAWYRVGNAARLLRNDLQTALSGINPVKQVWKYCMIFWYYVYRGHTFTVGNYSVMS